MEKGIKVIKFISGNKNKVKEVEAILKKHLPELTLEAVNNIDIPELQGDPEDIVKGKLKYALKNFEGPLMVEDTSLCFNSLKGLPGPYIKSFLDKIGHDGLNKMLAGFDDKSGYAQCIFGLALTKEEEPKLFVGRTPGSIVEARGPNSFGWDPIFQPDGFEETYAEMDKDVKNTISHRYRALKQLIDYLNELA